MEVVCYYLDSIKYCMINYTFSSGVIMMSEATIYQRRVRPELYVTSTFFTIFRSKVNTGCVYLIQSLDILELE